MVSNISIVDRTAFLLPTWTVVRDRGLTLDDLQPTHGYSDLVWRRKTHFESIITEPELLRNRPFWFITQKFIWQAWLIYHFLSSFMEGVGFLELAILHRILEITRRRTGWARIIFPEYCPCEVPCLNHPYFNLGADLRVSFSAQSDRKQQPALVVGIRVK